MRRRAASLPDDHLQITTLEPPIAPTMPSNVPPRSSATIAGGGLIPTAAPSLAERGRGFQPAAARRRNASTTPLSAIPRRRRRRPAQPRGAVPQSESVRRSPQSARARRSTAPIRNSPSAAVEPIVAARSNCPPSQALTPCSTHADTHVRRAAVLAEGTLARRFERAFRVDERIEGENQEIVISRCTTE